MKTKRNDTIFWNNTKTFTKKIYFATQNLMSTCCICLEEITSEKCETKCNHIFHSTCIFRSLSQCSLTCPICREQLVEENDKLMTISVLRILNVARNDPSQREDSSDSTIPN